MATEVSRSIEIQACAKIASELTAVTKPTTIENAIKDFEEAFDAVVKIVVRKISGQAVPEGEPWDDAPKGGRVVPVRKSQQDIQTELAEARASTAVSTGMMASSKPFKKATTSVEIAGTSHGSVPAWLVRASAKAGVDKVYDNRDTANAENRRPHFVSADGNKTGFWPPKNLTSEDVGIKFG